MTQKALQQMKHLLIQRKMEVLKRIQFTLQHHQVGQLLLYMRIQEMEKQLQSLLENGQEQL